MDEKLVTKIKNLLELASGKANQHESELAMQKALEICMKHNLSMDSVQSYEKEEVIQDEEIATNQKRSSRKIDYIGFILKRYFKVRVLWGKSYSQEKGRYFRLRIIGRESDVQIAKYVYAFLDRDFERRWQSFRRQHGLGRAERNSFMEGLHDGLSDKLMEQQKRTKEQHYAETGKGLIVVDKALETYMEKAFPNIRTTNHSSAYFASNVHEAGQAQGANINISTGVTGSSNKTLQIGR